MPIRDDSRREPSSRTFGSFDARVRQSRDRAARLSRVPSVIRAVNEAPADPEGVNRRQMGSPIRPSNPPPPGERKFLLARADEKAERLSLAPQSGIHYMRIIEIGNLLHPATGRSALAMGIEAVEG